MMFRLNRFFLVFSVLTLASIGIRAAESIQEDAKPNLSSGRFSLSANELGVGYATGDFGFSIRAISKAQYFILDRVAVGGLIGITALTGRRVTLIDAGPALTYYFYSSKDISAYVGAGFLFNNLSHNYDEGVTHSLNLNVGANYNISNSVGVGPMLGYAKSLSYSTGVWQLALLNLYFYL